MPKRGKRTPTKRGTNSMAELRREAKAASELVPQPAMPEDPEKMDREQLTEFVAAHLSAPHKDVWILQLLTPSMMLRVSNSLADLADRWGKEWDARKEAHEECTRQYRNGMLTKDEYTERAREYTAFKDRHVSRAGWLTRRVYQTNTAIHQHEKSPVEEVAPVPEAVKVEQPQAPVPAPPGTPDPRLLARLAYFEARLKELTCAVLGHQRDIALAGFRPTEHDRRLWLRLKELTLPHLGRSMPLEDLVFEGVWEFPAE